MKFFILICLLLYFFSFSLGFSCPPSSYEFPNEDVCVYAITTPHYYLQADRQCRSLGGLVAKVENAFENGFLSALITLSLNSTTPFIGVEKSFTGDWTYSDGSPLIYQNWAPNQPNMSSNTSICAIMDPQSGKWFSSECSIARPSFCTTTESTLQTTVQFTVQSTALPSTRLPANQCPDGWIYYGNTNYCYYLQKFTYPDKVHWQLYNWTTAEANCQQMSNGDSHLVSIHSKAEDNFIYGWFGIHKTGDSVHQNFLHAGSFGKAPKEIAAHLWVCCFLVDLITSNVAKMSNVAPGNESCSFQWALIGYYGNGTLGTGAWTDGSPVDYIGPTAYLGSGTSYWLVTNDQSCYGPSWAYNSRSTLFARFVCKVPLRNRIIKAKTHG